MTTPAARTAPIRPGARVEPTSSTVEVVALADPVIDRVGFDPRSPYAERFWLAVLGPTSLLLMRHLATRFDLEPDGFSLDRHEVANALGVGGRGGRNAPFVRAIARCGQFGLIRRPGPDRLAVRRRVPPLTRGQVRHLSEELQRSHARWQARQLDRTTDRRHDDDDRRVRRLALTLLELGDSPARVHEQLERWRFEPTVVGTAVRWAVREARDGAPTPPDAA